MRSRQKLITLILGVGAVLALAALAAGIATLDLNGGPRYILPEAEQSPQEAPLPVESQQTANYLGALTIVFLILLPLGLVYLLVSPSARRRFLIQLVQVSVIVLFIYLLYQNIGRVFPSLQARLSGEGAEDLGLGNIELRFLEPFKPQSPAWLTELFSFALAASFVYFLFWLWQRLRRPDERSAPPADQLVRSAQAALRQIDAGQNLRDVVLRCYHEMTQAAAQKKHLTRPEYVTPHEFSLSLEKAGLPAEQVQRLTALFEAVRYGHKTPGVKERSEAVACLQAVVERLGGEA
jgi:hypothetical protein